METSLDDSPPEDSNYHVYVQQKIERGIEAAEGGEFISDEEIERRIARQHEERI